MAKVRVGINGFGRMGRLALRAGWASDDLEFVHVNEVAGGPATAAHLLTLLKNEAIGFSGEDEIADIAPAGSTTAKNLRDGRRSRLEPRLAAVV